MMLNRPSLKILVDVGVGKLVEESLSEQGYDVLAVRSLNPGMDDADILHRAVAQDRMVVTMDKDFGELVYNSGLSHAGVLILRLEDADGDEKSAVVSRILNQYGDALYGKFCVFQNNRLRIRND